eukprot:m.123454 g.123454  ORF g.123454 m.123454 type:complete len:62 (+) comp28989_c0_seq3:409-594(+)
MANTNGTNIYNRESTKKDCQTKESEREMQHTENTTTNNKKTKGQNQLKQKQSDMTWQRNRV